MAPHEQTKYIQKLKRDIAAGRIDPEKGKARLAKLLKKPKKFIARWTLPDRTEATKTFPTKREALLAEQENAVLSRRGESSTPKHLRAKMSEVYAYYLENKMTGKASLPNARAACRYSVEVLGDMPLERLDAQADRLLLGGENSRYAKDLKSRFPGSFGPGSSLFNHRTYVHSAVAYWIKMKRARIVNPFQIWEVEKPHNARKRAPTFTEYKRLLEVARRPGFPVWMPYHIVFAWEQGRRLGEHVSLEWPGVHLTPPKGELPWVHIRVLKGGKKREEWHDIPVTFDAAEALKTLQKITGAKSGHVFAKTVHILAYWNRKLMDEAGFKDLRFHDFRRSFRNNNDHLPPALRMSMQGKKTLEQDSRYHTEQRKSREAAVASTYSGLNRDKTSKFGKNK